MRYASSITDLIGNTPLLALDRINEDGAAKILGKCEFFNPIAIKDRPALMMIREAERRGDIGPGSTLVEATSGNTGMALTYIGRMRGYKVAQKAGSMKTASMLCASLRLRSIPFKIPGCCPSVSSRMSLNRFPKNK